MSVTKKNAHAAKAPERGMVGPGSNDGRLDAQHSQGQTGRWLRLLMLFVLLLVGVVGSIYAPGALEDWTKNPEATIVADKGSKTAGPGSTLNPPAHPPSQATDDDPTQPDLDKADQDKADSAKIGTDAPEKAPKVPPRKSSSTTTANRDRQPPEGIPKSWSADPRPGRDLSDYWRQRIANNKGMGLSRQRPVEKAPGSNGLPSTGAQVGPESARPSTQPTKAHRRPLSAKAKPRTAAKGPDKAPPVKIARHSARSSTGVKATGRRGTARPETSIPRQRASPTKTRPTASVRSTGKPRPLVRNLASVPTTGAVKGKTSKARTDGKVAQKDARRNKTGLVSGRDAGRAPANGDQRSTTAERRAGTARGKAGAPAGRAVAAAKAQKVRSARRPKLALSSDPPPGFENLLKPQTTLVDVRFGDRNLGQVMATFEPGKLQFKDPEALVKKLPRVADPRAVTQALTGQLKTNPDRLCGKAKRKGCGVLKPKVAGIIFDEDRFLVYVFVNPAFLEPVSVFSRKFLPTPKAGPSLLQILNGAVSGSTEASPDYNFRGLTMLGYKDARIRADLSYSNTDDFLADQLFGEVDKPGLQFRGGLFRAEGTNLLAQQKIYGASVATSTDLRQDIDQAYGSQLIIFLPRRATVEILRDGRILDSRTYESGNQTLDTSLLPNGAYNVTLRIREAGGSVREEQRFFVKTRSVPPADQPLYLAQIGVLVDDRDRSIPTTTSRTFYRLGTAHRIRSWLALGMDVLGTDQQAIFEPYAFLFWRFMNLRVDGLGSTDGDYGFATNAYGTYRNFGYSVNFRRIWSPDSLPAGTVVDPNNFDPIIRSYTQLNGSINYTIGPARLGFIGSWRKGDGEEESYSFGPTLFWQLWRNDRVTIDLLAEMTRSNTATAGFAKIRFRYNKAKWTTVAEAGARHTRPRNGSTSTINRTRAIGRLGTTYTEKDFLNHELRLGAQIDRDDTTVAGGEAQLRGPRGQFRAMAEHVLEGAKKETRYNGGFVVGAVVNGKGVAVGGKETFDSAVVIRLSGLSDDAEFDVLVDDQIKGRVRTAQNLVLFLKPYEVYRIRLVSLKGPLVTFDANSRTVTLFPGTVRTLIWKVNTIVAVFGQALRPDGKPVANANIKGVVGIGATDDLGFFQVEVGHNLTLALEESGRKPCKISLGNLKPKDGVATVGKVVCR